MASDWSNEIADGWTGRVKLVTEQWQRKVKFSSPQAEQSIMGTIDAMRSIMDDPITVGGEVQKDDRGKPLPRRRFWSMVRPEAALEMIQPEAAAQLTTLHQLADIMFLARHEPQLLNKICENPYFLAKVAIIRDDNGNSLLHWTASADMPKKAIYMLLGGLRRLGKEALDNDNEELAGAIEETMKAENEKSVKLFEIAYASKDESLATELMRAKISIREKNRSGRSFVNEALSTDTGSVYLEKLQTIAQSDEDLRKEPDVVADVSVGEEDRKEAETLNAADKLLADFLAGDRSTFTRRLKDAIDREPVAMSLFFEHDPTTCATNRGAFRFGRPDRDGNDWLSYVVARGDLAILDDCLILIERHAYAIAEVYGMGRKDFDADVIATRLVQIYLRARNAKGSDILGFVIASGKDFLLERLLAAGLHKPQEIQSGRTPSARQEMLNQNLALITGRRLTENLMLQAALSQPPVPDQDQTAQATTVKKLLDVLFIALTPQQLTGVFQKIYRLGKPPAVREVTFLEYIQYSDRILSGTKTHFKDKAQEIGADATPQTDEELY